MFIGNIDKRRIVRNGDRLHSPQEVLMSLNKHEGTRGQPTADQILKAIEGIRYGSIEVIIHNSRVVQIERKEKLRFETPDKTRDYETNPSPLQA
jgi:hypothetical protein